MKRSSRSRYYAAVASLVAASAFAAVLAVTAPSGAFASGRVATSANSSGRTVVVTLHTTFTEPGTASSGLLYGPNQHGTLSTGGVRIHEIGGKDIIAPVDCKSKRVAVLTGGKSVTIRGGSECTVALDTIGQARLTVTYHAPSVKQAKWLAGGDFGEAGYGEISSITSDSDLDYSVKRH